MEGEELNERGRGALGLGRGQRSAAESCVSSLARHSDMSLLDSLSAQ